MSWNNAATNYQRRTLHVRTLAANLFDLGQILGCVGTEHFCAHTIPIVATISDICEPSGSKRNVAMLRYVLREYARTWQDLLRNTDSPEDANTLSPEVNRHVRSLESLCSVSNKVLRLSSACLPGRGCRRESRHRRPATTLRCSYPLETPKSWRAWLRAPRIIC